MSSSPAATGANPAARSSFYAGMRVLPKPEREAMYAIYAFARAVDDIADDQQGDSAGRAAALEAWRADIAAIYAGGEGKQAAFLAPAIHRFGLARSAPRSSARAPAAARRSCGR